MKRIIVSVAGSEGKNEYKDVQLMPGTKARDVLAKLGLNGFQLSRPEGGAFGFNDDLYQAVAEGQKVFATKADVQAGGMLTDGGGGKPAAGMPDGAQGGCALGTSPRAAVLGSRRACRRISKVRR